MGLHEFLLRLLEGDLGSEEIGAEVERRWHAGDFVHHLGAEAVPPLPAPERRKGRYGGCRELATDILYGEEGRPGCLLITTGPQSGWDESLREFLVPPHVHPSPHVGAVVRGEAAFVVARDTADGPVVVVEPVRAGSLVFCPAEAPHTFVTRSGFVVASAHARFVEPELEVFATRSEVAFHALPRRSLAETLRVARRA